MIQDTVSEGRNPFLWIEKAVFREYYSQMGPFGIAVYNALAYCVDDKDHCFPGITWIATQTGMSERKVQECLQQLSTLGVIRITPRHDPQSGRHTSNDYLLLSISDREGAHSAPKRESINETHKESPASKDAGAPNAALFDILDGVPPAKPQKSPIVNHDGRCIAFYERYTKLHGGWGNIARDRKEVKCLFAIDLQPTLEEAWTAYQRWYRQLDPAHKAKGWYRLCHFQSHGGIDLILEARRIACGEDDEQTRQVEAVLAERRAEAGRFERLDVA